jgi:hypothetical protein
MNQSSHDEDLDMFGLPGGNLDEFLAVEAAAQEDENSVNQQGPEEQPSLPSVHDFDPDPDQELTLYGAMRMAAEAAVDRLRGRKMSEQANAFRSYLISFRNELRR